MASKNIVGDLVKNYENKSKVVVKEVVDDYKKKSKGKLLQE